MIVAIDLETTWLDKNNDKIIELACIKFDENTFEILDEYTTLVNPRIHIPDLISNITNIFDEDVKNSPYIEDIIDKIKYFIWDNPILWHNTNFDRDFLIKNGVDISNNIVLDTFFISNFLVRWEYSLSLESLSKLFWIVLEWAHRAYYDTLATLKLFEKLLIKSKKLSEEQKYVLSFIFSKTNNKNIIYLRDLLWFNIEGVKDVNVLQILLNTIKPYKTTNKLYFDPDIQLDFTENIFKEFDSYEIRENQIKMLKLVWDSLLKDKKTVIEAPTWVWKTFAYLIPSILYSIKSGEKVVISTNTKVLQDQIIYKDLEFLLKNIWYDFSYTKLKWKRNYLWVNPYLDMLLSSVSLDYNEVTFLSKISLWLFESITWELDELNFYWEEYNYIKLINADKFYILKDDNHYRKYEYIYKYRQSSQKSNIVVVNHSLLLQDLEGDNAILWKIDNLVIDEVHNLEDTTTDAVKNSFTYKNIEDTFSSILRIINKNNFIYPEFDKIKWNILFDLSYIFDSFYSFINDKVNNDIKYKTILLENDFYDSNLDLNDKFKTIEEKIFEFINYLESSDDECYKELIDEISLLENYLSILKISLDKESKIKYINILSLSDNNWISISNTLLKPGEYLNNNLWSKVDSVILTSATLRIWDNFDYIKWILSLWDDFNFHILDTDFDYSKQSLLFIPNDLWTIKNTNPLINNFLKRLFLIIKWRALVLFTSFFSIQESYISMNLDMKKNNINLYAQWVSWWKNKLINFFKENSDNSILFWTDTFWEWVDIPGKSLEYLIIYKLPFMVPTDPIFKARSVIFKNSFRDYSIPKSILKLRQWFWRLIRTKEDRWIVIFLDDRILSTTWWVDFFKAFPENINIKKWNSNDFLEIIKNIKS